jgi:adenylate cyclase
MIFTKKVLIQLFIFFVTVCLMLGVYLRYPTFYDAFENRINDMMFLFRGAKKADENIIIIDIDEKSLRDLGQWPWSRDKVATLLQNLADYGVGMVGLDVVFAEADNSSPRKVFQKLGLRHEDVVDYDFLFGEVVAQTPTILGYVFALGDDGIKPERQPTTQAIIVEKNRPQTSLLLKPHRAILNIPEVQEKAYSSGYFNTIPDNDGVVRSIPLVMEYDGALYPALSLEMMRIALDEKKIIINYDQKGVESIELGAVRIPTDYFGRMLVNYRAGQNSYPYISASEIYHKKVSSKLIEGKIALLGTSAAGLLDLRSTPFESVYAGVEVHANAIDNILNQDFISKPVWINGVDVVSIVLVGVLSFFILLINSAVVSFLLFVALNFGLLFLHYKSMFDAGLVLNTIIPFLMLNLLFILGQGVNYLFESRQKELIKAKFSKKVSSAVVEELIKSSDDALEGKEEEITIFFSDIRGFTSISESMGSPKALIALLNAYMTPMVETIVRYQGTVDKFIGDAIMAYWNAPMRVENHPDKALRASVEQILSLKALNETFKQEGLPLIDIGIGLNTGLSIVGEMGSRGRSDYTCIGDAVNLASRAEGLCKPYGAKIILSEFTQEKLKEEYALLELDVVRVKGKEEPIRIYECYGDFRGVWKDYDKYKLEYMNALGLYRQGEFEKALEEFCKIGQITDAKLISLYIQRCEHYVKNPPMNFDGVFTFETK